MPPGATNVITHQNATLKRGRHETPEQGSCVVELASMLAGERFSDQPRSVCPVIAAYMRTVNDGVAEGELPALLPYASRIVDTRTSVRIRAERARSCLRWARELGVGVPRTLSWSVALGGGAGEAGARAARAALARGGPPLALEQADLLIADGAPADPDATELAARLGRDADAPAGIATGR